MKKYSREPPLFYRRKIALLLKIGHKIRWPINRVGSKEIILAEKKIAILIQPAPLGAQRGEPRVPRGAAAGTPAATLRPDLTLRRVEDARLLSNTTT